MAEFTLSVTAYTGRHEGRTYNLLTINRLLGGCIAQKLICFLRTCGSSVRSSFSKPGIICIHLQVNGAASFWTSIGTCFRQIRFWLTLINARAYWLGSSARPPPQHSSTLVHASHTSRALSCCILHPSLPLHLNVLNHLFSHCLPFSPLPSVLLRTPRHPLNNVPLCHMHPTLPSLVLLHPPSFTSTPPSCSEPSPLTTPLSVLGQVYFYMATSPQQSSTVPHASHS